MAISGAAANAGREICQLRTPAPSELEDAWSRHRTMAGTPLAILRGADRRGRSVEGRDRRRSRGAAAAALRGAVLSGGGGDHRGRCEGSPRTPPTGAEGVPGTDARTDDR